MPKTTKTKFWRHGGIEDKILEDMIDNGTLTTSTKPSSLKLMNSSVFGQFSDNVIRNHLNDVKRKRGLYCKKKIIIFKVTVAVIEKMKSSIFSGGRWG